MRSPPSKFVLLLTVAVSAILLPAEARPKPTPAASKAIKNEAISMSDGRVLVGDVKLPAGRGPFPVLLMYTPYGRLGYSTEYVANGYAHFNVDARGTGRSGGVNCVVCLREQQDVFELIDWASKQSWSTGNVGMIGGSYMAFIQLLVAAMKPPALKAIVPRASWSDPYRDAWYQNGLFNSSVVTAFTAFQPVASMTGISPDPAVLPVLVNRPKNPTPLQLALENPLDGPFYYERAVYDKYQSIEVPALFIGGWFDMFVAGMFRNFNGVASPNKRLIMGPWTHHRAGGLGETFPEPYPDVQLPAPDPVLAWYDHFLKGIENGADTGPRVLSYDIGTNAWVGNKTWPPAGTHLVDFYLSGAPSHSITSLHDGSLTSRPPTGAVTAGPDRYFYDPTTGVAQTTSNYNAVFLTPYHRNDERVDEVRGLTYTTSALTSPLELAGPSELDLWAATTASDTDWVVKLSDVAPEGTSLLLSAGYVRASQRAVDEARSQPGEPWLRNTQADLVPANVPVEYRIPIQPLGVTLLAGHRLRVAIYSADVAVHTPLLVPGWNTIYHERQLASVLRLGVKPAA